MRLGRAALVVFVGVVTLAAAVPPSPEPSETPAPLPLPEIGRTRANTPACAAMRDLVIPSFAAAVRADARFAETRKRLPQYVDIMNDKEQSDGVFRQSILARLDADASALLREALILNRALGDPRLSADSKDPQVLLERAQLQQLYEMQNERAKMLSELVVREHVVTAKHGGLDEPGGVATKFGTMPVDPNPTPQRQPVPATTSRPGMPLLSGNPLGDKDAFNRWGENITRKVRDSENQAAKVFLGLAQQCH